MMNFRFRISESNFSLQHLKEHRLHTDLKSNERLFYFTTCGWMMWNWLVGGLASGAAIVLYDGSPMEPAADSLFQLVDISMGFLNLMCLAVSDKITVSLFMGKKMAHI